MTEDRSGRSWGFWASRLGPLLAIGGLLCVLASAFWPTVASSVLSVPPEMRAGLIITAATFTMVLMAILDRLSIRFGEKGLYSELADWWKNP